MNVQAKAIKGYFLTYLVRLPDVRRILIIFCSGSMLKGLGLGWPQDVGLDDITDRQTTADTSVKELSNLKLQMQHLCAQC